MSMAAHNPSRTGFGTCLFYGPPLEIGLPIKVNPNRPLVMAHPAAAKHYHASFGLLEDAQHPFIQFMVDLGDYAPTSWSVNANESGTAPFQRLPDTVNGHEVYRKANMNTPHWQVHAGCREAYDTLTNMPPIDILYVDWLSWLPIEDNHGEGDFRQRMSSIVHKIRDGGLVLLDHKHKSMDEGDHPWFRYPEDGVFPITDHSSLENMGLVEWLAPNLYGDHESHIASAFLVHHNPEGTLGTTDWDAAMKPWFWGTVSEMSLQPSQIQELVDATAEAPIHLDATTLDDWMDTWFRVMDQHGSQNTYMTPEPPEHAWPKGSYHEFLAGLLEHPHLLMSVPEKRTYRLRGENFTLNIVYGNILDLAPALYAKNAVLALRSKLAKQVVSRCPWWDGQALVLQTEPTWMSNVIQGLTWSGEAATPLLAKKMLDMAKQQPYSSLFPEVKRCTVGHVVTVAHGGGTLNEVMNAVKAYYASIPEYMALAPMELTIVCLDHEDYTDTKAVPLDFQFLSSDGSCTD